MSKNYLVFLKGWADDKDAYHKVLSLPWATLKMLKSPKFFYKLMRFAEDVSVEHLAPNLKASTTIMCGRKDTLVSLWQGEKLNQLIPNSKLIVIEEGRHDWLMSHPGEFWKNI